MPYIHLFLSTFRAAAPGCAAIGDRKAGRRGVGTWGGAGVNRNNRTSPRRFRLAGTKYPHKRSDGLDSKRAERRMQSVAQKTHLTVQTEHRIVEVR
jgi:hypothetical protein